MHNRIGFNRLGRKSSHRKALHRNMVTSLIKYERIRTTQAKAKAIRITAEKLVTRAREDNVHNRRIVTRIVYGKDIVNKLFTQIAPRFLNRPGGYTRIMKTGFRKGDAAEMVLLEFVGNEPDASNKKKSSNKKAKAQNELKTGNKVKSGELDKAEKNKTKTDTSTDQSSQDAQKAIPEETTQSEAVQEAVQESAPEETGQEEQAAKPSEAEDSKPVEE